MQYKCKDTHNKEKIDFEAIRQSKIQMVQKFIAAHKEAERKGEIVFKPL
ncbi:hypothetical protein KKJ09_18275 [Xenorhabdus bovienii]|nr:hypothetical protein [Xenorhabdus bovienii]MDE9443388.1 hypothetical protein [Xenorhabdus bovienii]MDE9477067.1 hypothetical protein [Xenorhabdus bovienii]MDE9495476.1 hypothetical protein [Xenorhabdus bovienii]MDE9503900.1 hypothetical protein [Xenorhabdus bovienii]MDE9530046.1 hypothetical protein [Xenorhabdus bovienii]